MTDGYNEKYMRRALQIAKNGKGKVSPNPMVGAVIVANGRIIGEGFHRKYGGPHAEVNAINSVKSEDIPLLNDSTIYVTLEPCSHYGKTPPCSKLIIEKGIPRIVVGCLDPFKEVSGRGIKMLRDAGREVVTGVLETECRDINRHFMTAHTLKRPYIMLKWAESADRYIDSRDGNDSPVKFSTPITETAVHKLRAEFDAIMVGSNTVVADNPSLTVRRWDGRNPLRVVLDRNGIIPSDSKILTDGNKTLIFTQSEWDNPIEHICDSLYQSNITSLIVEGGAILLSKFIESGIWDEIRIETAPILLKSGVKSPALPDCGIIESEILDGNTITHIKRR